ncbi:hypothetical protein K461DRAFT_281388 [Myriangium duriaei CBS 260.36]|uniref:Phosphoglucomutase n=1 Tax=Myriangium duriaei CBS 260.36 TaxID=1168546 RepID=A0A9P4IUC3_9PEZI|nr:hypothetical protein K461DRAFT_281388 [Myriangium duriaei CBS 260.36]
MSAGFSRMNNLTVIQASSGLAEYILSSIPSATSKGIVLGHDARHNSSTFALHTAAVFLSKGFKVYWLGQCHTPLVPFSVGKYSTAGGVMVTASHNPKADNGYKVYWANGCQIIPPHDVGIAASIEANLHPSDAAWNVTNLFDRFSSHVHHVHAEAQAEYVSRVAHASGWSTGAATRHANAGSFTYTPMHGVGLPAFTAMLESIGLSDSMHVVPSQAHPDPEFSTVKFPNPEEKGALNAAIEVATQNGDSIIIANDPDADRFAAAQLVDGTWRQFTGNQLGVLLGSFVLEQHRPVEGKNLAMLASAVSSRMLAHIARSKGEFHFTETLTGFKWLGNVAKDLDAQGYSAAYAYEEAIGFMLSEVVYDKDGVAAAALFLAAMHGWAARGVTPWERLQELYSTYGCFEEANTYLVSPSPDTTRKVFEEVREKKPAAVGGMKINRWRDLTVGYDSATQDGKPTLPVDPSAQMITVELEGDVVFTVRGSGTEPKIKLYIEGRGETAAEAKQKAMLTLKAVVDEWFCPEKWGLRLA